MTQDPNIDPNRILLEVMLKFFLPLVLFCLIMAFFSSCATTKIVTVPEVHNRDSVVVKTEIRVDSIWQDRWHTITVKGDTVYKTDSVFIEKFRFIDRTDTVTVNHTDSVSVPYPVKGDTEYIRQRNGYDRFVSWGFWVLFLLLLVRIGWRIAKAYLKAQSGGIV